MKTVSQIISLTKDLKLVAYADIAFDSAQGLSVECWEVFRYEPGVKRDFLKTYPIVCLEHDDLRVVAEVIDEMCENALLNEDIYNELEQMHIEHYNEYLTEER